LLFQVPVAVLDDADLVADLEETGYQPSFTRLATIQKKPTLQVDPQEYLANSLITLASQQPKIVSAVSQIPDDVGSWLKQRLQGPAVR
jgi:hypothetical protein